MSDSESYTTDGEEYSRFSDSGSEPDLLPYQFEPLYRQDVQDISDRREYPTSIEIRLGNTDWCSCDCCIAMPTQRESICCREIEQTNFKLEEFNRDGSEIECLTNHPGFSTVCLDQYVLETAYYQYRQQYGMPQQDNEQQRYVAYRQLVRWCWGYLGKEIRVVIPACVVNKVRTQFPSEQYKGFEEAQHS